MPDRAQRKTVTVVFCDVTGSTAMGETIDPERLRALLADYFERMRVIVERHGGTVEKFIGDAVMAVFGVPAVHEDDALRAVRAAAEMREAVGDLGIRTRIGVNTGEVVTGTEERLATGDAVNVAARLEQAAPPGEVLLGAQTFALVRDAVEADAVEPLELKGKAEPVPAYLLRAVRDQPERPHGARFVGRRAELITLRDAFDRAVAHRRCELATVVGDAGVGKSRLAAETLHGIEAALAQGRCPPYGEGITYWPIVEVLRQLGAAPQDEAAAAAIGSLLGESEAPTSAEEIAWAFRRTVEDAATDGPLVIVLDDIQWGEDTFLDLVENLALLSTGAPILLLCLARPELVERRPAWPVALRLEPLPDEDVDELIPVSVPDELRGRISRAAGGNPLFVGEMVAIAGETAGDVVVPPTLTALLQARLDGLEPAERSVLQRGAVEGEVFHRGAVQAMDPQDGQVTPRLASLVRKELVRPEQARRAGEDAFRFRHLLIRDAAYDALPKAARADLHERLARWLADHGSEVVELDELVGFHLERACRYRAELGLDVDAEVAAEARRRLTAAGRRANLRADYGAAARMLERASTFVPGAEIDLALETDLVDALLWNGKGQDATARTRLLAERAEAAGDRVAALTAGLLAGIVRISFEPEGAAQALEEQVADALPTLEAAGVDVALYTAYHAQAQVEFERARMDPAFRAYERAAEHGRRAGMAQGFLEWRAACRYYGATPVPEILAWLAEHEAGAGRDHWLRMYRSLCLAMLGRFDEAGPMMAATRAELAEHGGGIRYAVTTGIESVELELMAGDPARAVELGLEGCRLLEELGEQGFLSSAAAVVARAYVLVGDLGEAERWAAHAREVGATEDAFTQATWRQALALVRAKSGDHEEAERLGREAVAIIDTTDNLSGSGDVRMDLAEVLTLAGKSEDAADELTAAIERFERKGNLVLTGRARERLASLRG